MTPMQRILVIGGNGAGKTSFSRVLAEKLNLPLIHLDSLYWKDHWEPVSNDEFDRALQLELVKRKWILDGNMARTLPSRLKYSDTVIYLDFPRYLCLFGIFKRYFTNIGVSLPDKKSYCPERISWVFVKGVWRFNKRTRNRFYEMIQNEPNVNVIVLKNRNDVKTFLKTIS